ncbi:MAG: Maf family protein [Clostridiales bacterium]|nr:Maf family protein [Clostridiales bacterium]
MEKFILASGSPRRRELLESMGLDFKVMVSDADENIADAEAVPAPIYVQELALIKAAAVSAQAPKGSVIIAADTIVTIDSDIMGKPADEEEAYLMLKALSGRSHEVYTGICVMRKSDGKTCCRSVKTEVVFKTLSDKRIYEYINTKEPMDKAGAYGIQGKGALLIKEIRGDYQNVVGLSVSELADMLEDEFDIDILNV